MFIVYSPNITPRLKYVFNFVFHELLCSEIIYTKNKEEFRQSDLIKINYSNADFETAVTFKPHGLLYKRGIEELNIHVFQWNSTKVFFKVNDETFPFDPFAAIFYLISRYEEYLPHKRDHYNRFLASNSLAYKNDFLKIPIVDVWGGFIRDKISIKHPKCRIPRRKFKLQSTIDVDSAYAFIEKGFVRTTGSLVRSIFESKDSFKKRFLTLLGRMKDPYDRFDELHKIQQLYNVDTTYFLLLGDYGLNDKNIPHTSKKFQSLIKEINDYYHIGTHPSFSSNSDESALKKEVKRLYDIAHVSINRSRQHFLKLEFPSTYRKLIDHEIKFDYTMGYAEELGFRAGTCSPFYFFDLDREQETPLRLIPFCIMDASLRHYLNVEAVDVVSVVSPIIDDIKKVDGTFTMLWHNESLSEIYPWEGWSGIYEEVIKLAIK